MLDRADGTLTGADFSAPDVEAIKQDVAAEHCTGKASLAMAERLNSMGLKPGTSDCRGEMGFSTTSRQAADEGLSTTSRTISRTAGYCRRHSGYWPEYQGIGQAASDFIPGVSPQNQSRNTGSRSSMLIRRR